jgi:hypothetical protein
MHAPGEVVQSNAQYFLQQMKIEVCPISGSNDSIEFINLGNIPLVNNLLDTKSDALSCKRYPLTLQFFTGSKLACLTEVVNKDELFLNYLYQTSVNKPYLKHCSEMYDFLSTFLNLSFDISTREVKRIVDIGGNDGSLLLEFRKKNPCAKYINVDASRSFKKLNEEAGIEYINEFFGEGSELERPADLIISTNVLQHSYPVRSFIRGVRSNLHMHGLWCLEFPYLLTTMVTENYDQIYHEHVYYFLLKNINDLCEQEGMRIINVSYRHEIHAGTLRVLSVRSDSWMHADSTVASFLSLEKMITPEYCKRWGNLIQLRIEFFREYIRSLLREKKRIIGFGAAAKGCVFLNTVGIDYKVMPYIIDDTPFKQGKFIPGTGMQVVHRDILTVEKPDYMLILAHNFKDYIIDSLKYQYHGQYIVMFPEIKIL